MPTEPKKKANAVLGKEDDMDWENKVPKPKHLDQVQVVNNHPFPTRRDNPTSNVNGKKRNRFHLKVDTNPRLRKKRKPLERAIYSAHKEMSVDENLVADSGCSQSILMNKN